MSFFNPEIPLKQKKESHHPWDRRIKDTNRGKYEHGHNSAKNPVYPKKTEETKKRAQLTVIGNRVTKEFIYCYHLAKGLHKYRRKEFKPPVIRGVSGVEWPKVWDDLKAMYGEAVYCVQSQVAILLDGKFYGGEKELKEFVQKKYIYHLCLDYYKEGVQQFSNYIKYFDRPCAYMHISIKGEYVGVLMFMLYSDIAPRTCQNFLRQCATRRGGYSGTPVHRIVKDCWIQCGGYGLKEDKNLDCENFIVPHDRRGVLCMANSDRHVDCSTQFFVLLQPALWMKHKYVAFGQLIEGEATLRKIESVPTWYESPTDEIKIDKAGALNMDCRWSPINKNTHAYLQGHFENILEFVEILYEELLKRVFNEIKSKIKNLVPREHEDDPTEFSTKNLHATERFHRNKEEIRSQLTVTAVDNNPDSVKNTQEENDEYDVEEYEYEFEDDLEYKHMTVTDSTNVMKPVLPYYWPFTDVPYPDEVDSTFNLQKMLVGDYCDQDDLGTTKERKEGKSTLKEQLKKNSLLFNYFPNEDNDSDSNISSDEEEAVNDYIKENMDSVSFGGHIIKKIANISKKFEVLNEAEEKTTQTLLTDEEIRMKRVAEKEIKETQHRSVSIKLDSSQFRPNSKVWRRPTGYIREADLSVAFGVDPTTYEDIDSAEQEKSDKQKERTVTVSDEPEVHPMRELSDHIIVRKSVLVRLYEEVASSYTAPTLKDSQYRLHKIESFKNPRILEDLKGVKMCREREFDAATAYKLVTARDENVRFWNSYHRQGIDNLYFR